MDDAVETETPVFTQEEVFIVAGFLAERWAVEGDHGDEIDEAIEAVLRRPKAWICTCNGWLDGVVLPPKTDCPYCHGTGVRGSNVCGWADGHCHLPEACSAEGRCMATKVLQYDALPVGHPENPEHPQNRIGRLIDSLYAIRSSILALDLKDALAGIDHALRMESVEHAPDHHYQTPEGWQ